MCGRPWGVRKSDAEKDVNGDRKAAWNVSEASKVNYIVSSVTAYFRFRLPTED